jgi:hypothetical protein
MNVKIGVEAALFPEKEYIKGIFVAVYSISKPPDHALRILTMVSGGSPV